MRVPRRHLNPFPGDRSVVVLDNASVHWDDRVRRLIEREGAGQRAQGCHDGALLEDAAALGVARALWRAAGVQLCQHVLACALTANPMAVPTVHIDELRAALAALGGNKR